MPSKLYTVGYEKRQLEDLLRLLKKNGVERLIDVRADVTSRREEFGVKLKDALEATGISYASMPELGIRREDRARPRMIVLREYEADLYGGRKPQVNELIRLVSDVNTACLLCYELNPTKCHRRALAHWLFKKTGCTVVHL